MLVKKDLLNEVNKGGIQGFKDCSKVKREVSQNLDEFQNLLINIVNC